MAIQQLESLEVANAGAQYETELTSYEIGVRQQKELVSIFGDRNLATISCMTARERAVVLGETSLQYVNHAYTEGQAPTDSSLGMWHDYLRGASTGDLAARNHSTTVTIYGRFFELRQQIRGLDLPFAGLVKKAGGLMVPIMRTEDYYAIDRRQYAGPEYDGKILPACIGIDPEVFFPEKSDIAQSRVAKKICNACDVRVDCLDEALESGHAYGIWGGLSERERRSMLRRQKARQA